MASTSSRRRGRHRKNPALAVLGNPGRELSREVHAVMYRHSEDGRAYRHDFDKDVMARLNRDGTVTLKHAKGKPLWEDFPERPYLVNPKGKQTMATKRKPPKGFRTWKAYMASIRPGAKRRKRRNPGTHTNPGAKMARKKSTRRRTASRRSVVVINPRKRKAVRRRSSYRRNPSRGIVNTLMAAGMDAVGIEAGRLASRVIPTAVNKALPADKQLPLGGAMGIAMQIVAGFAAGMVAEKVKRGSGRLVLAGAITAPLESFLAGAGIPVVSEALGAYPIEFQLGAGGGSFTPGVGTVGALSAYPSPFAALGSYPDEMYEQQM